jgi:hypothetical protein
MMYVASSAFNDCPVLILLFQITSRYEGVIKKLHFQADDTVPTGKV